MKKKKRSGHVTLSENLSSRITVIKFVITLAKAAIVNWINWLTPEG